VEVEDLHDPPAATAGRELEHVADRPAPGGRVALADRVAIAVVQPVLVAGHAGERSGPRRSARAERLPGPGGRVGWLSCRRRGVRLTHAGRAWPDPVVAR